MSMLMLWWISICVVKGAVLDPALYLSPSPPLGPSNDNTTPEDRWLQKTDRFQRDTDNLSVLPIEELITTTEKVLLMEKAKMFWPSRTTGYGLGTVHIPLTFSLSGTYGRYGAGATTGVIGSSYVSVVDDGAYNNYGKSGLAGSSYGSYGSYPRTRIYSGNNEASWSGWGNGKWGHYGKG